MKILECTSPTPPTPTLDPVLLHALIYIYRLAQQHSHSGLAVAGGSCRGAGALWSAARASGALLWPAAATQGRQRWFPSQRTNFCHAGEEEEQRNWGSPSAVGGAAASPCRMGSSASRSRVILLTANNSSNTCY